jgi:type III secretion protein U
LKGLFDVVKGLVGVAAIFAAGLVTLRVRLGPIASTWDAPAAAALASAASAVGLLLVVLSAVALLVSVPDLMFQRWWFRRQQRMSREELEREMKDTDGNPEVKRERMRLRYEQSQ